MIVEWNTHIFSADTDRYPFHPRAVYVPAPERRAADPLADYLVRMADASIDRAVIVQPEPYGDDHRLVLDCLAREPEKDGEGPEVPHEGLPTDLLFEVVLGVGGQRGLGGRRAAPGTRGADGDGPGVRREVALDGRVGEVVCDGDGDRGPDGRNR